MNKTRSEKAVVAKPRAGAAKVEVLSTGREKLFDAALRQVRGGSLSSVTARTICHEAGITAPTLYHYFGDLPGLYSAVLEHIFVTEDTRHPSERANPAAVIDYVWSALLQKAETEPGIIDLFNQLLASGRIPEMMQRNYERLEAAFENISAKRPLRVDPKLAAEIYWAAALGMATLVAATKHGVRYPTGAADVLRKVVLDGIFEANRQK